MPDILASRSFSDHAVVLWFVFVWFASYVNACQVLFFISSNLIHPLHPNRIASSHFTRLREEKKVIPVISFFSPWFLTSYYIKIWTVSFFCFLVILICLTIRNPPYGTRYPVFFSSLVCTCCDVYVYTFVRLPLPTFFFFCFFFYTLITNFRSFFSVLFNLFSLSLSSLGTSGAWSG